MQLSDKSSSSFISPAALARSLGDVDPSLRFADGDVWRARRQRLLAAMGDGAVAIIPGAAQAARNADVDHDFRQDSDFAWLAGFDEPDAVAVLRAGATPSWVLFVRPRDADAETWTGRRAGVDGAIARYGADAAFPIDALDAELGGLLRGAQSVHFTLGRDARLDARVIQAAQLHRRQPRALERGPDRFVDLRATLHELRLHKEDTDIAAMRAAAALSVEAHHEAMRVGHGGCWEFAIQAALEYAMRVGGSPRNAYPSIVAGGDNATILHYNTNRMRVPPGALVLVDAGAEVGWHAADITRTWPVDGRFSPPQRDAYAVVLAALRAATAVTLPGRPYQDAHDAALRALTEGLVALGVLQGATDDLIAAEAYKPWYMHRTGHWLGMDVHDAGLYAQDGAPRLLEPGMVITVEPGLYFHADDERVPAPLRGIGIRIEDDVLITATGNDNLTAACASEIEDIERVCAERPRWVCVER